MRRRFLRLLVPLVAFLACGACGQVRAPAARARQLPLTGVGGAPAVSIATPLSFFRTEEASGNRVDSASGGNDLAASGSPGNAAGLIGNAVSLNGTTQSLSNAAPSGMTLGTGVSWTLGMWVRPGALAAGDGTGIACKCNGSVSVGYDLFINTSGFRAYVGTVSNGRKSLDANGTTPATGTWFCVVMTFDASTHTLKIRVNDSTQSTLSTVSDVANPSTALIVGNEPLDGSLYNGRIDNLAYWQSALSSADITAFYAAGVGHEFFSGAWH